MVCWLLVDCCLASLFLIMSWLGSEKASRSVEVPDHLKVASCLGIARFVIGLNLAVFLWWKVQVRGLPPGSSGDGVVFLCLAGVCVTMAILRLALALGALRWWSWTRKLGLGFAVFDTANLVFFPVSTALGLQGFVAYRHSETLHYFRRSASPESAA